MDKYIIKICYTRKGYNLMLQANFCLLPSPLGGINMSAYLQRASSYAPTEYSKLETITSLPHQNTFLATSDYDFFNDISVSKATLINNPAKTKLLMTELPP